ncbi:hypothetical protein AAVH_32453, partial [Aphelenchoides avenae]
RARLSGLTQSCGDFPRTGQQIERIVFNDNIPPSWRLFRPKRLDIYRPPLAPRSMSAPATSRAPVADLKPSSRAGIHSSRLDNRIVWYVSPRRGQGRRHRAAFAPNRH